MKPRYNPMTRLGLAALLILISVVMTVGVAWGRYRTELEPFEYWFATRNQDSIYLWGGKTGESYDPLPGSWSVDAVGSTMPFLVSNGISSEFSAGDVRFTVQVAVTEGILSDENLGLQLAVIDGVEEPVYQGIAAKNTEGTSFYSEFGGGWLYRFYDENGTEMQWTLEGGQLSEFVGELHISGTVDPRLYSMMQLQVIAVND